MQFLRLKQAWTGARHAASNRLTEELLEHPARLAQGRPAGDAERAHDELAAITCTARRCDRLGAWLVGATAPAWLLLALLVLAADWRNGFPGPAAAASALGVVLLIAAGLDALTVAADDLTDGAIALTRARPLLAAETDTDPAAEGAAPGAPGANFSVATSADATDGIDAADVSVVHPGRARPSLRGFTHHLELGQRVLLSGPSGSGKSTAVAALAGMIEPNAGTVHRTGTVVAVPQHHRNHLFSGTLLFNLLLGRGWPPTPEDMARAERACRALELGALIDRMPGGLNQHIGETGWQLSDGERTRVFAARALLQEPDFVLLDETLSALDPVTAAACRDAIAAHAGAVLLTHHP